MSTGVLLEVVAGGVLFFLILLYRCEPSGIEFERFVCRTIVAAALVSGLLVAVIGIIEFVTWNGKILWTFVPYDWGAPQPEPPGRATGPFVNPDHFGNYLALVLPLAIGGALFRPGRGSRSREFRLFSAVTALLIICGILLSLSRGAWIASAIAVAVLFALSPRVPSDVLPRIFKRDRWTALRRVGVVSLGAIALSLLFIGARGRGQVDSRLQETVQSGNEFGERLKLAAQTLKMVRDYPLFGVGLGCWPELFPHYQQPPWSDLIYRETHNDYAQLLAETGFVGFALATWFFVAVGRRVCHAFSDARHGVSPILVAICAALSGMAFHEFFDFSLHTPANLLLFIVLVALAVRTTVEAEEKICSTAPRLRLRFSMMCISVAGVILIVLALRQEKIPYPYDVEEPKSGESALSLISAHPAESALHLDLVNIAAGRLSEGARLAELFAAVWLDPNEPYARDEYALALFRQKRAAQGFAEVTRSVLGSPSLSTHFYLRESLIARLTLRAQRAVEEGFNQAFARGYLGAAGGLADFYTELGRLPDAAETYHRAAIEEHDPDLREEYLVGAGVSYSHVGDLVRAQKLFEVAVRNNPADVRPYQDLATMVYGPQKELNKAQEVIGEGVRAGADGPALYDALADAARNAGNVQLAESALNKAADSKHTFDSFFRLGAFYLDERKYDYAALNLHQAAELNPQSADAYFYLGLAEESNYLFWEADRDFSRALQLAPANASYRSHYSEFRRKLAQGFKVAPSTAE
jgi:O-antigen ligase/Tfp pilus assembly protein PilF